MSRVALGLIAFVAASILGTGSVSAGEPSDLVITNVAVDRAGGLGGSVKLKPDKGPSIADALLGIGDGLFDLTNETPFTEITVEPFFDETQFPGAPPLIRGVHAPATLPASTKFFGTIGHCVFDPAGISEEDFRNQLFVNYEIDVDGVMVQGDLLDTIPVEVEGCFGRVFNVTQQITMPGTHHIVYRFLTKKEFPDQGAGVYEIHFTVIIE